MGYCNKRIKSIILFNTTKTIKIILDNRMAFWIISSGFAKKTLPTFNLLTGVFIKRHFLEP